MNKILDETGNKQMRERNRYPAKQFYGINNDNEMAAEKMICDPFDMKSNDFNCDLFLNTVSKHEYFYHKNDCIKRLILCDLMMILVVKRMQFVSIDG